MRYSVSSLMDEIWERAVETALDGEKDHASVRTLTLDGAGKCIQGRLPPPSVLEKFQNLQHLSIASIGVSSLEQFPKLLKLERLILSDNRIAGGLQFLVEAGLDSLSDLDLSNNRIQNIEDLAPLAQLKLVSLDLYECPVTRVKDYRSRVFKLIKSLKYLDKMDLHEKERPESEEEDEDDSEDEEEEEDEDPGSGEIDGEDRQFVECNGHGEGVGGVVNVDEEEESEAEEEEEVVALPRLNGPNHAPNGLVRVEHVEEDGDGENDFGEEIDDDEEDFDIDDIRDHFVEVHPVHPVVESSDDEEDGIDDEEDDDNDDGDDEDDDDESDDDDDDEESDDDDDDEMGIGNIAQVEFAFDEPLPNTSGLFFGMSGEIDGHEQGGEDADGDNNGETGEEEIGIEYDPEFEDDDDNDEEEDVGAGYLVQPVSHSEVLHVKINGRNNDEEEEEEEIDDNDSNDAQVLPPSSSNLKRKRDDDGGDEQ